MKKIVSFLMATVILLPIAAYFLGTPPNDKQLDILKVSSWGVGAVIIFTFVVGQLTGNNSQVDKLWSIVPAPYAWFMTWKGGMDERMVLMSVLVTIWAARLTFNFARRGGYSWKFWAGEEDYRWEVLRQRPGFKNPIVWLLFNLFFICFYQNTLIFLFTVPVIATLADNAAPLGLFDWILAGIYVALVVMEFVADQQQYDFQTEKYRRKNTGEDLGEYADGFIQTGLWSKMRHPNYFAEQAIWVVFYLFSVAATGEWINWTIAGSVLLIILFKGSSDFSEEISAKKYPKYADYQKRVGRFLPKF
jgi:steroid 5-alpha reductase family enzyme